jgi:hypothetical protein
VLHELPGGHTTIEVVLAQEVIVDPVDLARTGVASGRGNRQLEARNPLQKRLDERSLADA